MSQHDDLNQKMLELIHDLLSKEEVDQLLEQVAKDPEAARVYTEAKQQAELFAKAARLEEDRIELKRPMTIRQAAGKSAGPSGGHRREKMLRWGLGIAAALLIMVTAGGYVYQKISVPDIGARHIRLLVASPPTLAAGVENPITIRTQTIDGEGVPAKLEIALYDEKQNQLLDDRVRKVTASADGVTQFTIPADVQLPKNVRFEVMAYHADKFQRSTAPISVRQSQSLTRLALDKPWYKTGDMVRYRSVTLDSHTLAARADVVVSFEILDPGGASVAGSAASGITERGVGNGEFQLTPGMPGGQYTLVARSNDRSFAEQRKTFLVRQYRLPRLKKEMEFARDSYVPGEKVIADLAVNRAEGGTADGAEISIIATVDGETIYHHVDQLGTGGTYQTSFALPEQIETGAGQLAIVVDDGGTRETIAKTIPINLGRVDLQFYPEGGDLVAGLPNRVYFVAKDPKGDPVHIEGHVVDESGNDVARLETVHEGRGVIRFTPSADARYRVELEKPAGTKAQVELPKTSNDAYLVLSTAAASDEATGGGVFDADNSVRLNVQSTKPNLPLVIVAYCRGVQVGQETVTTQAGKPAAVNLPLGASADGVIRLTVYDYSGPQPKPVAERLVYRRPKRELKVEVVDQSAQFAPGDSVALALMVTDETGRAAAGSTLGVAVVDDALLGLARETQRHKPASMPTHFRLATEIEKPEDLEDVDFYVDDSEESAVALDLLLGTQGWRRFVQRTLQDLPAGGGPELEAQREQLNNLLVSQGADRPPIVSDNIAEVREEYEAERAEYDERTAGWLAVLGTTVFGGGIFLVLVVAAIGILRLINSPKMLLPALTAATACLLVGVFWMTRPATVDIDFLGGAKYVAHQVGDEDKQRREELARNFGNDMDENFNGVVDDPNVLLDVAALEAPDAAEDAAVPMAAEAPLEAIAEIKIEMIETEIVEEVPANMPALAPAQALPAVAVDGQLNANGDGIAFEFGDVPAGRPMELGQDNFGLRAERRLLGGNLRWLRQQVAEAAIAGDDRKLKQFAAMLDQTVQRLRLPVRQYAHVHSAREAGVRSDFTETVYWNPLLIADQDGRVQVRFDLSDAVTTFRVLADAHSGSDKTNIGRIGHGGGDVVSRIPFSLQPKLPLEVNAGDLIELPVAIVNDTTDALNVDVALQYSPLFQLDGPDTRVSQLAAGAREREYFQLEVVGDSGEAELTLRGQAGLHADAVRQSIRVVPPGFPVSNSFAGKIEGDEEVTIDLPENWVAGSLQVAVQVFPSTLADLQKGLDGILAEPYGCFEQASTSNYPNVLCLSYMEEHRVADPAFTRRAKDLLKKGYARLSGYECKQKGYEWFGSDPGHEALTAYGLMEFNDMAEVFDVDPQMVQRTAAWLMARRDGKGRFQRNPRALDSFGGAPDDVTNAYIVWALTEAGQEGLETELAHVIELGRKSEDPYVVALAAASAMGGGQQKAGRELLEKLKIKQQDDGHLLGTQGSITRSGGHSLKVETTALAALAWLKEPSCTAEANKAIEWIVSSRKGSGGFGSTQATIMALKAMVEHSQASRATVTGGDLIVLRDDEEIGRVSFDAGVKSAIVIDGLADQLEPGENVLTLKLTGDNVMPYTVEAVYRTRKPVSDEQCPIRLSNQLAAKRVKAGETVAMTVEVSNSSDEGQPMTLAVLGIPAGLTVRPDQLDELKRAGTIDYFETNAREVVCYWRALAPNKKVSLQLDLVADIPGRYTAPASRAYLYYTAEQKWWTEPVSIRVER